MSKAVAVKEAVKESLLGSEQPVQLSSQTKARFNANAIKDADTGELYLGHDEFVDAIAPPDEDYVSFSLAQPIHPFFPMRCSPSMTSSGWMGMLTCFFFQKKNSTRSSESSTASCYAWPIVAGEVASP